MCVALGKCHLLPLATKITRTIRKHLGFLSLRGLNRTAIEEKPEHLVSTHLRRAGCEGTAMKTSRNRFLGGRLPWQPN